MSKEKKTKSQQEALPKIMSIVFVIVAYLFLMLKILFF